MKRPLNTLTIALIPVAIAINIAVGQIVYLLKLPVYLDSIGTVLVGMLAGPLAGMITGALSNVIWSVLPFGASFNLWYFGVAAVIGLLAGIFANIGWSRKLGFWLLGSVITAVVAAILSALITSQILGGSTGAGTDVLVALARSFGAGTLQANFIQGMASEIIDKPVTYLVTFLIALALPLRVKVRFPNAENLPK